MTTEIMAPETDYYTDYASSMSAKSFVGQLLRHNRGDFIFGLDGDTLPAGTRLVAITEELQIGWTRWENNSPAESKMGLLVEGFTPPAAQTSATWTNRNGKKMATATRAIRGNSAIICRWSTQKRVRSIRSRPPLKAA